MSSKGELLYLSFLAWSCLGGGRRLRGFLRAGGLDAAKALLAWLSVGSARIWTGGAGPSDSSCDFGRFLCDIRLTSTRHAGC
jgi:hypothetical protein